MKKISFLLFTIVLFNNLIYTQEDKNLYKINKLIALKDSIESIHPALENLYPIAVFVDNNFRIYEYEEANDTYKMIKTTPSLRPVINGIRAAFPLEENDYKMTCVVTADAFENLKDYSVIFHEFIHCFQAETIEYELKDSIDIYKIEMEAKNYMWEINYDFPYNDSLINKLYTLFIYKLDKDNLAEAEKIHDELKQNLSPYNYQFLVWVEWKEGSARWIENLIREKLNVDENIAGKSKFSRTSFYYGGSNYIKLLSQKYKTKNLKSLFELIYNK